MASVGITFAQPAGAYDDIAGTWQSETGRLTIDGLGGQEYEGDYRSSGKVHLRGRLDGQTFTGLWIAPVAPKTCTQGQNGSLYWGRVNWTFDADFTRFTGHWTYCDEERAAGNWIGRRDEPQEADKPMTLPPEADAVLQSAADPATGRCNSAERFALVLHGGAVYGRDGDHSLKAAFIQRLLARHRELLAAGASALDVVQASIRLMEDSGVYNAGRGAIANQANDVELDASIMEGRLRRAGAVAAVRRTKNPISAARLIMEQTKHVLLVGPQADAFIAGKGGESVEQSYFRLAGDNFADVPLPADLKIEAPAEDLDPKIAALSGFWFGRWGGAVNSVFAVERLTAEDADVIFAHGARPEWGLPFESWVRVPATIEDGQIKFRFRNGHQEHYSFALTDGGRMRAVYSNRSIGLTTETLLERKPPPTDDGDHGTVGAVALDRCGDLAAGTSTGGFDSKIPGRVGDSPIIGAGTYADNETAAISATGHGEFFIRYAVAHEVTARIRHRGETLEKAAQQVIKFDLPKTGLTGGIIAVDRDGNVATPFNTSGMVRGAVGSDIEPWVEVY